MRTSFAQIALACLLLAPLRQVGGTRGVELSADLVLPPGVAAIPTASNVLIRLVVFNRRATTIEIDSVRSVGKEGFDAPNEGQSRALTGIGFRAYVDELLVTFRCKEAKSEYRAALPFPVSGVIAPGSYVCCTVAVATPPKAGIYTIELKGIRSAGEPRLNTLPLTSSDVVSVTNIPVVVIKHVSVGRPLSRRTSQDSREGGTHERDGKGKGSVK
jgi:hypothetical protein